MSEVTRVSDPPDEPGYADALAELDGILRELESSDVDVDRLGDRVARAADLISMCRQRIDRARLRIDQVIADLDADDGSGDDEPGNDGSGDDESGNDAPGGNHPGRR